MHPGSFKILVIDDERSFLLLLTSILRDEGYNVRAFASPVDARSDFDSFGPDLVITDLKMPGMDGIRLMEELRTKNRDVDFIVITAFGTVETAVEAMKKGARDYITKPLKDPDQLRMAVAKIFERRSLINENILLRADALSGLPPIDVLFAGMEGVLRDIRDVAPTDATVLLCGETGTGKSLVAKVIHHGSGRTGPFVDINCAAIPENLLESELFGFEKGAFTGAANSKKGKFELASDGTLFLDEVSDLGASLQAKLLRVLQERIFEHLGGLDTIRTNARIIAATNRDLKELLDEKRFREDLYYRLNVFPIRLPSLRQRREHLPIIAAYLVQAVSERLGKAIKTLTEDSMRRLAAYPWPGNIRELENVLERSAIVSRTEVLEIPPLASSEVTGPAAVTAEGDLKSLERKAIEHALMRTGGHRKKAAELLGISLRNLQYKIKDYGIGVD